MELRHLIYFETVARHQHVSRAAEELAIAQPAITKQVHDLEKELGGGPLFEKIGRNLQLTQAGHTLLVHARAILAQVEVARSELREHGQLRRGKVTIGVPPTVGERLLPRALAAFHKQYPELELRMHEANSQKLLALLESGEVDIIVVSLPVSKSGLRVVPLLSEELVAVVSLDHRLAGRDSIRFSELAGEPFLLYPPGYVRDATLMACKQAGFSPRVVLDGGSVDMLLQLAEVGLGVTVTPQVSLAGNQKRLAALRISDPVITRTLALASHEDRALSRAALALRAFLEEHLLDEVKRQ